jgi:hypothetical protein
LAKPSPLPPDGFHFDLLGIDTLSGGKMMLNFGVEEFCASFAKYTLVGIASV